MNEKPFDCTDVEVLAEPLVYKGFFRVREVTLRHRLFAGGWSQPISREVFLRGDAVDLLLFDPVLEQVALVEQFRVGALERARSASVDSPWLLELVAGMIDKDEAPDEVARREAREETGLAVDEMESIADYYASPGGCSEYFYLYCARADLSASTDGALYGLEDESEDIRLHLLSLQRCWQMLDEGAFNNAHIIIALQWLRSQQSRLQVQWCQGS